MFKIFATTLRHLATHARKLQITGDCFETGLRPTRDVCRQLSQNSRSPVRLGLYEFEAHIVLHALIYKTQVSAIHIVQYFHSQSNNAAF